MWKITAGTTLIGLLLMLLSFLPLPAPVGPGGEGHPTPLAEQGQRLFRAKGCTACHRHDAVNEKGDFATIGPNLTHYRAEPQFLRGWLADPQAVRPYTTMPDLDLSPTEIEALIAFLVAGNP